MKREILFKAKRVDNGELVFGYLIRKQFHRRIEGQQNLIYEKCFIDSGSDILLFDNIFQQIEVHPDTVCQFTGLLDKNGVKIFEGDKIKHWGGVGMIVYKDATYYLMTKNEFGQESFIHITQSAGVHGEVIGNIHDKIEKP